MDETASAVVTVRDPHNYWRPGTLADLGCGPGGGYPSWVAGLFAQGTTALAVVDKVLRGFNRLETDTENYMGPRPDSARPAELGYVRATTQTWIAYENGRTSVTIQVTQDGAHFTGGPEAICR